jgi:hypothetical protein
LKLFLLAKTPLFGKAKTQPRAETASLFLPLARFAFKTLRPPLVFIRTKKPCVLLR